MARYEGLRQLDGMMSIGISEIVCLSVGLILIAMIGIMLAFIARAIYRKTCSGVD
jgi:hypothetical protein